MKQKTIDEYIIAAKLLKEPQYHVIFLLAIKDLIEGVIDANSFSSIAVDIYYTFCDPFVVDTQFDRNFARQLSYATEYSWYVKNKQKDPKYKDLDKKMLKGFRKYYENNMFIIDTSSSKA
jgi:hypothetical protein